MSEESEQGKQWRAREEGALELGRGEGGQQGHEERECSPSH